MANNFINDYFGFGVPDIYKDILGPSQADLENRALKRGVTMGLLDYFTTPKNMGFGSGVPYITKAVGTGLQNYQGGIDTGLATALKMKALEKDKTPSIGAPSPEKFTLESLQKYSQSGNWSDLVRIPDATTASKVWTQPEIDVFKQKYPGLEKDTEMLTILGSLDKDKSLKELQTRYAPETTGDKFTNDPDRIAKATFGGKLNSETGQPYPANVNFGGLNPTDAQKALALDQQNKINVEIAKNNAMYDTPDAKFSRANTLNSKYEQALTNNKFEEMRTAFKQVEASVQKGTPIGDVASATKIMKLLDPGSVVRESELGIALNQTRSLVDRWTNWTQQKFTGEQLTEKQRKDFYEIATDFYKIAKESKNRLDQKFINYAKKADVDPEMVVGLSGGKSGALVYDINSGTWKAE